MALAYRFVEIGPDMHVRKLFWTLGPQCPPFYCCAVPCPVPLVVPWVMAVPRPPRVVRSPEAASPRRPEGRLVVRSNRMARHLLDRACQSLTAISGE